MDEQRFEDLLSRLLDDELAEDELSELVESVKSQLDRQQELQAQLEGAENRINVARVQFNQSVEDYNASIRKLPGSLIAGLGRFQRKAYFQAANGATKAVGVSFN